MTAGAPMRTGFIAGAAVPLRASAGAEMTDAAIRRRLRFCLNMDVILYLRRSDREPAVRINRIITDLADELRTSATERSLKLCRIADSV